LNDWVINNTQSVVFSAFSRMLGVFMFLAVIGKIFGFIDNEMGVFGVINDNIFCFWKLFGLFECLFISILSVGL